MHIQHVVEITPFWEAWLLRWIQHENIEFVEVGGSPDCDSLLSQYAEGFIPGSESAHPFDPGSLISLGAIGSVDFSDLQRRLSSP